MDFVGIINTCLAESNINLIFNLNVYNVLSEFNLKFEGRIISSMDKKDITEYSVKFNNIDKYTQVQLDEVIKSRVSISNHPTFAIEDGEYTLLLCPRKCSTSIRNKMRMIR